MYAKQRNRAVWRLITEQDQSPPGNLAREEAIARAVAGTPTLRLWRNSPCVLLGRFQVLEAEVDQRACAEARVPVYRRFTGGGAVYHDPGNLNVSLFLPRHQAPLSKQKRARVPGVYSLVLEPLGNAVRSLGCAAVVTNRDLQIEQCKVSGVAAWLGVEAILLHATLLIDSDLALLEKVLDGPGGTGNARWEQTKSHRARVTCLTCKGSQTLTDELVETAVVSAFATGFGCVFEQGMLTPQEEELAAKLLAHRYLLSQWHAKG